MWLSLLGPLHVESQGTLSPVPAAKQRALLAALAISANNVVHADMLAEAMWGGNAPPSKADTIRTYVHRLRGRLGPEAAQRILVRPPGYLLRVGSGELDLLRFESLVREGRACAEAGDWEGASARLSQAERLWRGTPLADIPERLQHGRYIRYLEQTRLGATELRIEAGIRLSRRSAAGVIPELQDLVTQHPERERLCLLLMLAMFRASRQAEALRVFAEARSFSVAEYGVNPGPELAQMHSRVLAQDPILLTEQVDRSACPLPAGYPRVTASTSALRRGSASAWITAQHRARRARAGSPGRCPEVGQAARRALGQGLVHGPDARQHERRNADDRFGDGEATVGTGLSHVHRRGAHADVRPVRHAHDPDAGLPDRAPAGAGPVRHRAGARGDR